MKSSENFISANLKKLVLVVCVSSFTILSFCFNSIVEYGTEEAICKGESNLITELDIIQKDLNGFNNLDVNLTSGNSSLYICK